MDSHLFARFSDFLCPSFLLPPTAVVDNPFRLAEVGPVSCVSWAGGCSAALALWVHGFQSKAKQGRLRAGVDAIVVNPGLVGGVQVGLEKVVWLSSHQKVFPAWSPLLRKGRWTLCLDGIPQQQGGESLGQIAPEQTVLCDSAFSLLQQNAWHRQLQGKRGFLFAHSFGGVALPWWGGHGGVELFNHGTRKQGKEIQEEAKKDAAFKIPSLWPLTALSTQCHLLPLITFWQCYHIMYLSRFKSEHTWRHSRRPELGLLMH